jgi:undecaprenyl phosphate N,N'-diacetylbacillosamine 1-phosphate transferase
MFAFFVKRVLDIVLSIVGLLISFPIFLVVSLIILLSKDGSVFFLQNRIGKAGKVFCLFKFRTMIENAENVGDGLTVRSENDNRVTKIGKILRKTSLDELPQLINVLIGDMSIVGPRPPVTYFPYNGYDSYPEWAKRRFDVRPGITGLVQVSVRNSVSWDERIKIDIQYIKNYSLLTDIKILMKTFCRLVRPKNIYGADLSNALLNDKGVEI